MYLLTQQIIQLLEYEEFILFDGTQNGLLCRFQIIELVNTIQIWHICVHQDLKKQISCQHNSLKHYQEILLRANILTYWRSFLGNDEFLIAFLNQNALIKKHRQDVMID